MNVAMRKHCALDNRFLCGKIYYVNLIIIINFFETLTPDCLNITSVPKFLFKFPIKIQELKYSL
jgi:hypothetical protein